MEKLQEILYKILEFLDNALKFLSNISVPISFTKINNTYINGDINNINPKEDNKKYTSSYNSSSIKFKMIIFISLTLLFILFGINIIHEFIIYSINEFKNIPIFNSLFKLIYDYNLFVNLFIYIIILGCTYSYYKERKNVYVPVIFIIFIFIFLKNIYFIKNLLLNL